MTLHAGLTYSIIVQSFSLIPHTVFELRLLKMNTTTTTTTTRRIAKINISVVTYANLTILLANMHIDSGYLVVVKKEGCLKK